MKPAAPLNPILCRRRREESLILSEKVRLVISSPTIKMIIAAMKLPSAARNLALGLCAVLYSASLAAFAQSIDLPEGLTSQVAAAPPLVNHPIMATLGPRGQLFVGDA